MMISRPIYLDDLRYPKTDEDWIVLRTSQEAVNFVKTNGMVDFISFDHDLGGDDTAIVFIKWLIDYDIDNDSKIIPSNFTWNVHSANPVGAKNIDGMLTSYMKFKSQL